MDVLLLRFLQERRHSSQEVVIAEGWRFLAAGQTGAAGSDAADDRQVSMMEDGQLDGQTAAHPET